MTQLIPNPKSLIPRIGAIANALVAALAAPACAVCNAILEDPLSGCVCRNCWGAIRPMTPPLCDACGDPLPRPTEFCLHCRGSERIVHRSRAVGEYDGTLREIIHAFKYSGRRSLARPIATLMRERGVTLLDEADYVVPVPLHWRREYRRGFNQARELARYLDVPLLDVLVRTRFTRPQVELAADSRYANVQAAFTFRQHWPFKSRSIDGANVVLVDDVSTTGATLEACAKVLRQAGASAVYTLTAARVVTRQRRLQI